MYPLLLLDNMTDSNKWVPVSPKKGCQWPDMGPLLLMENATDGYIGSIFQQQGRAHAGASATFSGKIVGPFVTTDHQKYLVAVRMRIGSISQ